MFTASLFVGYAAISLTDGVSGLLGTGDPLIATVMQEIRLPRTLLAAMVGASLGLSGAAMQGFLRKSMRKLAG